MYRKCPFDSGTGEAKLPKVKTQRKFFLKQLLNDYFIYTQLQILRSMLFIKSHLDSKSFIFLRHNAKSYSDLQTQLSDLTEIVIQLNQVQQVQSNPIKDTCGYDQRARQKPRQLNSYKVVVQQLVKRTILSFFLDTCCVRSLL